MAHLFDTDTIPIEVQARNMCLNNNQVYKVAEEEETFPIEGLKKEEGGYLIGGNTHTLITLKDVPLRVNTAEAYTNATRGLSLEWKSFMGNILLDWATGYESNDLTIPISVEFKVPKKLSYTVDNRVEGVESDEVKRFCKEHGLEETIYNYTDIVCEVFENATRITLSLTSDPEIEGRKMIKINISTKSDIEAVLKLDEELFKMIDNSIPDRDNDYFVKTYDLIE